MKKQTKWLAAGIAVIVLVAIGVFWKYTSEGQAGNKEITINVEIDGKTETFTYRTDVETLKDLLVERTELQAVMEDSTYGPLLTSMLGKEQNMEKGPWWLFESETNKDCVEQSMCPVLDQVHLMEQDTFLFKLTDELF